MDYVGVIIGPDLAWRDGRLVTDPAKRSRQDRSIRGYKSQSKSNPEIHDRVGSNRSEYIQDTDEPGDEGVLRVCH